MKKHAAIFMFLYIADGKALKRSREEKFQRKSEITGRNRRNRRNLHQKLSEKGHKTMNVEVSASLRTNWRPDNVSIVLYPLFCTFRNRNSYKITGTLQNKKFFLFSS